MAGTKLALVPNRGQIACLSPPWSTYTIRLEPVSATMLSRILASTLQLYLLRLSKMFDFRLLEVISDGSSDWSTVVYTAEVELYCKVALASLLLYHNITTMDKEVRYFWGTPVKTVNLVYFLNRYIGLFSIFISIQLHILNVSTALCSSVTWVHNLADWTTVLLIDYILLIRVLALYHQARPISVILKTLLILEASLRLAFMIVAVSAEVAEQKHLMPSITACVEQNKCSRRVWETLYCRITPFIFQLILAVLALYKAAEFWRLSAGFKGFKLVEILMRDQISYFGMVLLCSVVNIVKCWAKSNHFVIIISTVLGSTSLLCLLGSVMLVNLKQAGEQGLNGGTSYRIRSASTISMEFA